MSESIISPFLGTHDHDHCRDDAVRVAEEYCQEHGLRFTRLRREVLEIVWKSHKPIRAYDVLEHLRKLGHRPAPPTAYRALDFLVEADLIHRIESLNAYVGCPSPDEGHFCQFLICDRCGTAAEFENTEVNSAVLSSSGNLGFIPKRQIIEIHGLCKSCTTESQSSN